MLLKICSKISAGYKQSSERFKVIQGLKCESIFETFKNVALFNNLQNVKRDIRAIKGKPKKNPEGYKIKQSLYKEVRNAETFPRAERDLEAKRISTEAFKTKLEQKRAKGKKITKCELKSLRDSKYRKSMKFLHQSSIITPILLFANKDDISSAYYELGTQEAIEEADKSAFMGILGLSLVKQTSKQCRNLATTAAIYAPACGRIIKSSGFIGGIFAGIGIKLGFDKLWQTEYEKYKNNTEQKE